MIEKREFCNLAGFLGMRDFTRSLFYLPHSGLCEHPAIRDAKKNRAPEQSVRI
jgi:hypothetical protein